MPVDRVRTLGAERLDDCINCYGTRFEHVGTKCLFQPTEYRSVTLDQVNEAIAYYMLIRGKASDEWRQSFNSQHLNAIYVSRGEDRSEGRISGHVMRNDGTRHYFEIRREYLKDFDYRE